MTVAALMLFLGYLFAAFIVRTGVHVRRTGDHGWRGISGRPGTPEWWAGVSFVAALIAGVLGPVTAMTGLEPLQVFHTPPLQWAAAVLTVAGVATTSITQAAMGDNWRIGVDKTEATALVTSGPFAVVRNPIFTAMAITGAGLAFMVPNVVALIGLALLLIALELQVRIVEEPHLRSIHGPAYQQYEAAVGRFLPGIGRSTSRPSHEVVS